MYLPFIQLFKKGDPARAVSNVTDHNRVANILNDLGGYGCRIEKPVNGEGRGWKIIVDGVSSDVPMDTGASLKVTAKQSIEYDTDGKLHLVADSATPGARHFYAVDTAAGKGWKTLPEAVGNLAGTPSKLLARDTAAVAGFATLTTTAVDLAPQLRVTSDTSGYYLQVRCRKVKLSATAGAVALAADTYGAWSGVGACDT
jgi:hypothetical protein